MITLSQWFDAIRNLNQTDCLIWLICLSIVSWDDVRRELPLYKQTELLHLKQTWKYNKDDSVPFSLWHLQLLALPSIPWLWCWPGCWILLNIWRKQVQLQKHDIENMNNKLISLSLSPKTICGIILHGTWAGKTFFFYSVNGKPKHIQIKYPSQVCK